MRSIIDKENSLKSRDRQHQREYLKQIGICELINNLNSSKNSSTSLFTSFDYKLFPSNATSLDYWFSIALYHRPRYAKREEFEEISSEQSKNEKVWHVNTKVLKALCIKGKNISV